jgi:hypothetical protein
MPAPSIRTLQNIVRGIPNLFLGYNVYVNRDKFRLIDRALGAVLPGARSLADLGGVWRVNAAYARYALSRHALDRAVLVDADISERLYRGLSAIERLTIIQGDFADASIAEQVGPIDVVLFFDVLLHQANPDWDAVLARYASLARCMVIYNQQYLPSESTVRLTALPMEEYTRIISDDRTEIYEEVYARKNEIHPGYRKPWGDIHEIIQWGITDRDLRATMERLGFSEAYYRNYGRFSGLPAFENHGFVFVKRGSEMEGFALASGRVSR